VDSDGFSTGVADDSTTIVSAFPVLSIAKTHTGNFSQGQQGTYTVTVSNGASGGSTSGSVAVTDTVPSGLTLVSMTGTGWSCGQGPNPPNVCVRLDPLGTGASYPPITVTVNVANNAPLSVTNQVTVSGGGSPMASATDATTIAAAALSMTKTHSGNFTQGQQGTYTVTVSNGASAGATNGSTVTVGDTVPSGLTLVSMAGTGWTCPAGGTSCTRSDSLASGASYPPITVTVNVAANAPASVTNMVGAAGGGSSTSPIATDQTTIVSTSAVLSITKTHMGNFGQGQQLAPYTVTVSNSATAGPTSGTVTVTDTLPTGLTLASTFGTGWSCGPGPTVNCTRNDALAPGASYPPIMVNVNVATNAPSQVTNAVMVSGGGSPPNNTVDPTTIIQEGSFVELVSEIADGSGGNSFSQFPFAASMTGRYVVFLSEATDLVSSPPLPMPSPDQVYVHDTCIGAPVSPPCPGGTQMVSVDNNTPPDAGNSGALLSEANISGDGSVAVFDSAATNLVVGAPGDSYERQICGIGVGGCPSSTSVPAVDNNGNPLLSVFPVVSRDGRFVAFQGQGLGPLSNSPAFLHDTCLGAPSGCVPSTTLLSVNNSGQTSVAEGIPLAVSTGGRFALFFDDGPNMPDGGTQTYIRDTCNNLVGNPPPPCTPTTTAVSVGNSNPPNPVTDESSLGSMSDDGRYVAFFTANKLVPNDLNGAFDLYIRDTCLQFGAPPFNPGSVANCTPTTALVSVADTGNATAFGVSVLGAFALDSTGRFAVFGASANDVVPNPPVPNNTPFGYARDTCLQFGTPPNLNPGAVPGCTPTTVLVTVDSFGNPISTFTQGLSGDGHFVVFQFRDSSNITQIAVGTTSF